MLSDPFGQLFMLLRQQAEADYIGEPLSQLDHALQGAMLAEQEGASEHLILATLLHDIGHICDPRAEKMADVGVKLHEHIGADYLRSMGLAEPIAQLVENHVNAKRYLVFRYENYARKLSAASAETLKHQGGAMSADEAATFEGHPQFTEILKLRAWDEAAKRTGVVTKPVDRYAAMIKRNRRESITPDQLASWREQGYLKLSNWFDAHEIAGLRDAVDELQAWPDAAGKWMKYYEGGEGGEGGESSEGGEQLCRIENFIQYHPLMARLVDGTATHALLSQLLGEPSVLFKEKINFKLAGGKGFIAHQDAPAFTSFKQQYHITLMYSFDASTPQNGCLEVVPGGHREGLLPTEADLTIAHSTREALDWVPVPTEEGDLLLFDSFLPHRSSDNRSAAPRRALYATYNRRSEGSVRQEYYKLKRESFPPEVEREAGREYHAGVFNVGNPVTVKK